MWQIASWGKNKEHKAIETLDCRNTTPRAEIPMQKSVSVEMEQELTPEVKYQNAIEELKVKFLLAIADHPNDWYPSPDLNKIVYRDIFVMEKDPASHGGHYSVYNFHCKGLQFHQNLTRNNENDPRPINDPLIKAYVMISNKLHKEEVDAEYMNKLDQINHILEQI